MRALRVVLVAVVCVGVALAGPVAAASKPSKPRNVAAAPLVKGVKVSWKEPRTKGGCAIRGYRVDLLDGKRKVLSKSFGPGRRSKKIKGLAARHPLKAVVRARNCGKLGFKSSKVFVPRLPGPAPVGDTALGTYWLPGGLGGVSNIYEIWKFDPLSHSIYAGQRNVYTYFGTLGWQWSYSQAFVYTPSDPTTIVMKVDQTTTINPTIHTFKISYYDANLDELGFMYDGTWTGAMGGCRHPQVIANIPWLCA